MMSISRGTQTLAKSKTPILLWSIGTITFCVRLMTEALSCASFIIRHGDRLFGDPARADKRSCNRELIDDLQSKRPGNAAALSAYLSSEHDVGYSTGRCAQTLSQCLVSSWSLLAAHPAPPTAARSGASLCRSPRKSPRHPQLNHNRPGRSLFLASTFWTDRSLRSRSPGARILNSAPVGPLQQTLLFQNM